MGYLQHRISHMWDASKQLFDKGYLTIGWKDLANTELIDAVKNEGESGFNRITSQNNITSRNRWCLFRFLTIKPGDTVIVPLYEQDFAIVEVTGKVQPISELPISSFVGVSGRKITLNNHLFYEDNGNDIDLGFFIPIKIESAKIIKRAFASARLQSRMKHQYINVDVNDLSDDIVEASSAKAPLNLRDIILETAAPSVLESIHKLTPDGFEHLVKWYMDQCGATHTYIPAKNEPGKENGADADVIAEFLALGIVIFIQVKKHEGYTDDWAITQISNYKEQKENLSDDFTYIPWVITTASFKEEVKEKAHDVGVRLIDGITFAKMIVDTGISSINDIISN